MADPWMTLRQNVSNTPIGGTFNNNLLSNAALCPQVLCSRSVGGGNVLFSNGPETIDNQTLLAGGAPASSVNYNIILFTDTGGLIPGTPYRLVLHHANNTATTRTVSVRAINLPAGVTIPAGATAQISASDVFGSVGDVRKAGLSAAKGCLDEVLDTIALPPGDVMDVVDGFPVATSNTFVLQPFDPAVASTIMNLASFQVPNGQTVSAMMELLPQNAGIHIYVVMGDPPATCYKDDTQTAVSTTHRGASFDQRLILRILEPYVVTNGTETPGLFRLVTVRGADPDELENAQADIDWTGFDNSLWSGSQSGIGGVYGRMYYSRVSVSNQGSQPQNIAIVANPRSPSSAFFGYVRDIGANATLLVPNQGSVAQGNGNSGTVIWKGPIPPGQLVHKRFGYIVAGGSAGKLSLWVVPF